MDQELKAVLDEQANLWEAFKRENDARLAAVETKGVSDGLKAETLDRMESRFAEMESKLQEVRAIADRPALAPTGGVSLEMKAFGKMARGGKESLSPEEAKALSVADSSAAGFLAPTEYVREIIKGVTDITPFRGLARVRSTGQKAIQIPRRSGQFAASWVAESGTKSETTGLTYALEEIAAHEMYALVDVTNAMLEDSVFDLEGELRMEFAEQFAKAEGTSFVTGTGSGQPEGFTINADVVASYVTNSGSASTIADSDGQANGIITAAHALKADYARAATWMLNRTTLGSVRKLKDGDKNYIWAPGLAGLPNTILGLPYVEATDMASEGSNTYAMALGDWRRAYTIVDRIAIEINRDPYTQATTGKVRFIARRRVGGQVVLPEAIRLVKCAA